MDVLNLKQLLDGGTVKLVIRCVVLEEEQEAMLWQPDLAISAAAKLVFVTIVAVSSVVKQLTGCMEVIVLSDVRLLWMKSLFVGMSHTWTALFVLTWLGRLEEALIWMHSIIVDAAIIKLTS